LGDDGRGDGFVDGPVEADDTFLGGEGLAGVLGGGRAGGGRGEGGGRVMVGEVPLEAGRKCHLGIVSRDAAVWMILK